MTNQMTKQEEIIIKNLSIETKVLDLIKIHIEDLDEFKEIEHIISKGIKLINDKILHTVSFSIGH